MSVTIQLRRDPAANWTSVNPVLYQGEMGVETDTGKFKFGDGVTAWNSLSYWTAGVIDSTASDIQPSPGTRAAGAVGKAADAGHVHGQPPMFAPTGLTGAVSASRYAGATASAAPVSGTFVTGDFVIDQTGKVWICTAGGTPGTWAQAGAALDATATDIKPLGVQAAGAIGKGADAGHIHPYQAWQFMPESYGAKRDGKIIVDATIGAGALSTLTSASAGFTSGDTGKSIIISQAAGSAFKSLAATITFVNSTTVTLSTPASAGGVTSVGAIYGTDDTAAIQSAINAAATYAASAPYFAEVLFTAGLYCIAGAAVVGGGTAGNSQLTLPVVTAGSGYKVNLALRGLGQVASAPDHWLQTSMNPVGATLVCMRTDGTYDATNGPAAVIGGPVNGYGGGGGTFSNMQLIVDGLTVLAPYYSSYGGLMAYGVGQLKVGAFSFMVMGVVPSSSVWPQLSDGNNITGSLQYTAGIITPTTGNNALNTIDSYTCYGAYIGISGADHLTITSMRTIFTGLAWLPATNAGAGGHINHGTFIGSWCCEVCHCPIFTYDSAGWNGYVLHSATASVHIGMLQLESYNSGQIYGSDSPVNFELYGIVHFEDLSNGINYYGSSLSAGFNLKLVNMYQQRGPVSSPQAAPATTVAWPNRYYLDAEITLSVSGGTLSALTITGTAGAITQTIPASTTFYRFTLPSGQTYTPTYTGSLTHTVTLL